MDGQFHKVRRRGTFTIYGLVDRRDGVVRYVGCTKNIKTRLACWKYYCGTGQWQISSKKFRSWLKNTRNDIGLITLATAFDGSTATELEQLMHRSNRSTLFSKKYTPRYTR